MHRAASAAEPCQRCGCCTSLSSYSRVKTPEKIVISRAREGQIALLLRIDIKVIDYAESFPIC